MFPNTQNNRDEIHIKLECSLIRILLNSIENNHILELHNEWHKSVLNMPSSNHICYRKKTELCINNIVKSNIDKSYLLNITYSVILMQNDM